MSWRAITEADVLTQISGDELTAIRAAALGTGQADPVAPTMLQVTRQVRGYVAGNPANGLEAGDTVPDELIRAAVALIVVELMPRAGGLMIDQGDARRSAARDALAILRDVAAGRMVIVQPTVVSTEVVGAVGPSSTARDRSYKREDQDGI